MATMPLDKKESGTQTSGVDKAKETAANIGTQVKDLASAAGGKIGEAAAFVGKKVESASSAIGSGIKSVGESIRAHTPDNGVIGGAGAAVAGTMETGGRYLQDHGFSDMTTDVTELVRRNPIPAVCISLAIGFLLAKVTSRS